jgi:hypothetical protein
VTDADEDVLRFIAAGLPSVWALELLLMLKRERRQWRHGELVAILRASDVVVTKALDANQLYRARPNAVRRAIVVAYSLTGSRNRFAR